MANQEHLDILAKGVETWNAWRADNQAIAVDLSGADLSNRHLDVVDLHAANLNYTVFGGSRLRDANIRGAEMLQVVLRDADAGGASLAGSKINSADLVNCNLTDADLDHVRLRGTALNSARLVRATIRYADLCFATAPVSDFTDANLSDAILIPTDFTRANLRGSVLHRARLQHGTLDGADLSHADLTDAILAQQIVANVDLSTTIGLATVRHEGPSSIGLDTIYRSQGRIPEAFLRGAGVPENFITYMRSLTGAAFEFYSCFISYSTEDQTFAERLHADLQARGARCWFAPHDLKGGRKLHEQIDDAIRVYDKLLLILSDASMSSEWVSTEISKARKRELKENRRMLFPISLAPWAFPTTGASGLRQAVVAGGKTVRGPHEAWIAVDPRGMVRVLITGPDSFERSVGFAPDEDAAVITEMVRASFED